MFLHTVTAVIVTEIATGWIPKLLPAYSAVAILLKYAAFALVGAALLGSLSQYIRRDSAAYWAWVLPVCMFVVLVVSFANTSALSDSVLLGGRYTRSLKHFLGMEHEPYSARDFAYTLTLLRGVGYSLGAFVSARLLSRKRTLPVQKTAAIID
jgi:hypothetical protein